MTITWTPPLDAPTVTATAIAGGSIPDGTYYVRVCAAQNTSWNFCDGGKYTAGLPSVETSVTLSGGNNSISISYPAVSGASGYNIYITTLDSSNANRWYGKKIKSSASESLVDKTTTLTNVTYTDTTLFNGSILDTFAITTTTKIEGNLDRELGSGYLTLSGTCGTVSLETIYDYMVANGYGDYCYYDGSYFALKGGLFIDSGATGSMSLSEKHLIFIACPAPRNSSSSFTLSMTNTRLDLDRFADNFNLYATLTKCLFSTTANAYLTGYKGGNATVDFTTKVTDGGYNYIADSVGMYQSNPSTPLKNPIIGGSTGFNGYIITAPTEIQDATMLGNINFVLQNTLGNYTIRGGKWLPSISGGAAHGNSILFRDSISNAVKLVDVEMPNQTSNRRPYIAWTGSGSYGNTLDIYFSYLLKVVDSEAQPVESASVFLSNKNGVEVINTVTDVNGYIGSTDILCTRCTHKEGTNTGYGFDYTTYEDYSAFILNVRKYGYVSQMTLKDFNSATTEGVTIPENSYVVLTEIEALALNGIEVNGSSETITLTESHTLQELYDYCQAWSCLSSNLSYKEPIKTSDGSNYVSEYNLVIDGCELGGTGAETLVNHTLTLLNGGTYTINITDTVGTYTIAKINNLSTNSRVQIFDITSSTELYNNIVESTVFTYPVLWTEDRDLRVRIMKVDGATAKKWVEDVITLTKSGVTLNVNQEDDTVYNSIAIDGSTISECSIEGTNIVIEIEDEDNQTTAQRLYAFEVAWLYTESGIRNQELYIDATDTTHFIFEGGLQIKNMKEEPLEITGGNIVPVSGSATNVLDMTGGSIFLNFNRVEGFAYPDKALTTEQENKLNSIPSNPLLTNDERLNHLDADVSGIPTNALLTNDSRLDNLDGKISDVHAQQNITDLKIDEIEVRVIEFTT